MKGLILILLIAAVVFSPFGKSRLPIIWRGFVSAFGNDAKSVKINSNEGSSYSRSPNQTSSYNQTPSRPLRGAFTQLRQEMSSAMKQNSTGHALSQQRTTNARDFNYSNTASLKQQRYENDNAFKQSNGSNASQSLSQARLSMSRELSSY